MRIISGVLKGRIFKVPSDGVRPTTERTREAIFSSLASRVVGANVLDLFAGSGGIGLEALSRGAKSVVAVEENKKACDVIKQNFQMLDDPDLGDFESVRSNVYSYSGGKKFDIIFADPPYDKVDLPKLLDAAFDKLANGGILVFEMRAKDNYVVDDKWLVMKEKEYGSTKVIYLEQKNG